MARYRILAWREIPTQVQVTDDTGDVVKRPMPRWFMQEISRITMREGIAGTDEYLAEFDWSEDTERDGTATEIADAVVADVGEPEAVPPPPASIFPAWVVMAAVALAVAGSKRSCARLAASRGSSPSGVAGWWKPRSHPSGVPSRI